MSWNGIASLDCWSMVLEWKCMEKLRREQDSLHPLPVITGHRAAFRKNEHSIVVIREQMIFASKVAAQISYNAVDMNTNFGKWQSMYVDL